jgi:hypothetical protein
MRNGLPEVALAAVVIGVMAAGCSGSSGSRVAPAAVEPGSPTWSYDPYAEVLLEYVDARGRVDYASLSANPGALLDFVARLENLDPASFQAWTDDDRIAVWINAYNALTLKAIVDHWPIEASVLRSLLYPRNSIRQIPGVWTDLKFRVMGTALTLDGIEHRELRSGFDEPRIHMALVCAAMGCPPLRWEPYSGEKLDAQLEDQSVRFLASPERFRIDRDGARVELSSIFKWFGDDFIATYEPSEGFEGRTAGERAVLSFIASHLEGADREWLESGRYEIVYLDYDWSLNESPAREP